MDATTRRLRALARRWGGDVQHIPKAKFSELLKDPGVFQSPAEDRIAVHWPKQLVVYHGRVPWPFLVHEMAHVFATLEPPDGTDEDHFTAWEYAVAKLVRGDMKKWLQYSLDRDLGDDDDIGLVLRDMGPAALRQFFARARRKAITARVLDSRGRPKSVVRPTDIGCVWPQIVASLDAHRERHRRRSTGQPIYTGKDFEERMRDEGFIQGYQTALEELNGIFVPMET